MIDNDLAGFLYGGVLLGLSLSLLACLIQPQRPPWWLVTAWAVFAMPVLFVVWTRVVLA